MSSIQIIGFIVRAQKRYTSPLPEGEKVPRVRSVSARFTVRSAAEEFVGLYAKAHPDERVWVDDLQAEER
jgi:hypothetical protein